MAIIWYDEAEAEKLFQTTFVEWASWDKCKYKGCYSAQETKAAVEDAKTWAGRSDAAQEVLNFVFTSKKSIHVVGMRGGYQCFNSTEGAEKNLPVVFVDLDGKLTVNIRTPHNMHLDPSQCQGNTRPMDNRIALLHEFGHAKQWIETPQMFDNVAPVKGVQQPQWGLASQGKGGGQFDARLDKAGFAKAILAKATALHACPKCGESVDIVTRNGSKMYLDPKRDKIKHPQRLHICSGTRSAKAVFPTEQEVLAYDEKKNPGGYKPPVWGAKIEMDNMSRHEWPICRELGIVPRSNYRDINGESDGAPSLTSQITRMAEAEKKKNATLKEVIVPPGQVKCPYCDFVKSRMFVNNHIRSTHPGNALLE
jgi:hypothetical protein